ncbi:alpha/beta fold hydrolase [Cellulomonas fengjieae]|uniref:Alpha/beta hydrolase n=1 Tax=Cellulomonas fengjieae TaxID=2819978 RepID=A0ABS3SCW0_9CELL|nr:alpha/beta hydrolase [Cellulomonas fengjieae]MBO3083581.1 alpha/beta hydrolase [Cellulomonas fengjieae]QVI65101.1 alpha/beta hydrolase [Cellulomonas fengjieae]
MSLPVVLVHGLRTSRTMWRAQVETLERVGRRAVAVDLPGHGSRIDEPFTLDAAVDTITAAIDEVGGRAFVVGLSLGGYVAIRHAARHPDQVAGLLAASCSTRPHRLLLSGWSVGAHGIARLPDRGAGLNQFLVDRVLPAEGAADVGAGGFALDATSQVLREMTVATPVADLARVEAPVWLVNGAFDHFRGEERRFLAACRDGRLVVVPRATHLVSLVQPARFGRVMLEALDEVEQRERARVAGSAGGSRS